MEQQKQIDTYSIMLDGYAQEHGLRKEDARRTKSLLEMHFPKVTITVIKEV